MSALFDVSSLLTCLLLAICTCAYLRALTFRTGSAVPSLLDHARHGFGACVAALLPFRLLARAERRARGGGVEEYSPNALACVFPAATRPRPPAPPRRLGGLEARPRGRAVVALGVAGLRCHGRIRAAAEVSVMRDWLGCNHNFRRSAATCRRAFWLDGRRASRRAATQCPARCAFSARAIFFSGCRKATRASVSLAAAESRVSAGPGVVCLRGGI